MSYKNLSNLIQRSCGIRVKMNLCFCLKGTFCTPSAVKVELKSTHPATTQITHPKSLKLIAFCQCCALWLCCKVMQLVALFSVYSAGVQPQGRFFVLFIFSPPFPPLSLQET